MTTPQSEHSTRTDDALHIWHAAIEAVKSDRLIRNAMRVVDDELHIVDEIFDLNRIGKIIVVGAGKAGAGMAEGVESALGEQLTDAKVTGWINVPSDCVRNLRKIHLHPGRPASVNEPTEEGVAGTQRILELVSRADAHDIVIVLLSGGGSALLPAPREGLSLADKQVVTRLLMQRGATIQELNTVRKQLSLVKGGGLVRACRAGRMIGLIISDVIGDPLEIIASGPTVPDSSTAQEAWDILTRFAPHASEIPENVRDVLQAEIQNRSHSRPTSSSKTAASGCQCKNIILGNNATALQAAEQKAVALGYHVINLGSNHQGVARDVGVDLAEKCLQLRQDREPHTVPVCLLSGGEPVVHVVPSDRPRKGGRNQELVLAALERLWKTGCEGLVILSGGTDGEDGPTDAAGAVIDQSIWEAAHQLHLKPGEFLSINDAYHFFEISGGLIVTGPTHTNVMDVRVCLIS